MDFLKYYLKNSSRLLFPLSKNWLKALWENLSTNVLYMLVEIYFLLVKAKSLHGYDFRIFPWFFQIYSNQCTGSDSKFLDLYTSNLPILFPFPFLLHFDEKFPVHLTEITKPIQLIHFFVNTNQFSTKFYYDMKSFLQLNWNIKVNLLFWQKFKKYLKNQYSNI